jgi:hypothetical protein
MYGTLLQQRPLALLAYIRCVHRNATNENLHALLDSLVVLLAIVGLQLRHPFTKIANLPEEHLLGGIFWGLKHRPHA